MYTSQNLFHRLLQVSTEKKKEQLSSAGIIGLGFWTETASSKEETVVHGPSYVFLQGSMIYFT